MATGLLHPAALSAAVAGSARRLVALAGALSPGADVGLLSRAMEELERLAGEMPTEPTATASTDMEIDSGGPNQLPGGGSPGTKRRREAPGVFQRPAKRRILAWRASTYRHYLVAKARATARRARSRRARVQPPTRRRNAGGWKGVERQLARASLSDGLHRWSPGGGGPAAQ